MTRTLEMLPSKLHHFWTVLDNISRTEKTVETFVECLRLEENQLIASDQSNESSTQNALVSKKGIEISKEDQLKKVRHKTTRKEKYTVYCKSNYTCNVCNQRDDLANECLIKNAEKNNKKKQVFLNFITNSKYFLAVSCIIAKHVIVNIWLKK